MLKTSPVDTEKRKGVL